MDRDALRQEWCELSTPWIRESREGRNPTRNGLLDPPVLEACGDVSGLRVLDSGCGEGRFCRIMLASGAASVLGIDLCEPMIAAARELQSEHDRYQVADAQQLGELADASFELVVSYLNQCDLPDIDANNREVFRLLKPGGRFVVANLHPMRSSVGTWHKNEAGDKLHVAVDEYFNEGERHWRMMGVDFTNFHRTLETTIGGFLAAGFALERLIEPTVSDEQLAAYPELADERRVPNFVVYGLRKPG